MRQRTITNEVSFTGTGLHTGKNSKVTIKPGESNSGIQFQRIDLNAPIPSTVNDVLQTQRCTTIGKDDGLQIKTIEHLLSAIYALGIDNLCIEVEGEEIPLADGCAERFYNLLESAHIIEQDCPKNIRSIAQPIYVAEGKSTIVALPSDDFRLSVSFTNDHQHPALSNQFIEYTLDSATYIKEIAPARTFGFKSEAELLIKMGLIKGVDLEHVVIMDNQKFITPLRFSNEIVRHKVLDIIGDLALLGPLQAHIIAIRPSHSLNNLLAREIYKLSQ